jgi:hypothetical protein
MTPQPATSLRVRFALSQGYQRHLTDPDVFIDKYGNRCELKDLPIIDANTVREALMGMTQLECG